MQKVVHIDGDVAVVGKTAAELCVEIQALLDNYHGNITNAEALGVLAIVKHNLLMNTEDEA